MNSFLNRDKIKFVLIDWFGVLSANYYWCIQSQKNKELKDWCDCVFDDPDILNDWMRGKYDLEYLTRFRGKIDTGLVIETFLKDIAYYKPDEKLLDAISGLFPNSKKILVTDNFSLFEYILKEYEYLNSYFHKIYLSNEIGLLKNDRPFSLFDFIQADLELSNFKDCLLIDDNKTNCENFMVKSGRVLWVG